MSTTTHRSFDISQIGMTSAQETVLKSMLAMLQGRANGDWQFSGAADTPGIIIVNLDAVQANELQAQLARYPKKIVAAIHENAAAAQIAAQLPADSLRLDAPLRVMNLLDTLNLAAQRLTTGVVQKSAPMPQMQTAASPLLLALHDLAQRTEGILQIALDQAQLTFFIAEKKVFFEGMVLAQLNQTTAVKVTPLSISDPAVQHAIALSQPWDTLLWQTGLQAGQGALLPWLAGDCTYRLRRWPESGLLSRRAVFVRLAAHFSKELVTPESVAQNARMTLRDVTDFVNACSLCGYLVTGKRAVVEAPAAAASAAADSSKEQKRSLFGKIRSKLGL